MEDEVKQVYCEYREGAEALARARAEFDVLEKTKSNPMFASKDNPAKHAILDDIYKVSRKTLAKYGLALELNSNNDTEMLTMHCRIIYSVNVAFDFGSVSIPLRKDKNLFVTAHTILAARTIATRAILQTALCLAGEEDDDGNSISKEDDEISLAQKKLLHEKRLKDIHAKWINWADKSVSLEKVNGWKTQGIIHHEIIELRDMNEQLYAEVVAAWELAEERIKAAGSLPKTVNDYIKEVGNE